MLKTIVLSAGILFIGATSTSVSAQGKQTTKETSKTDYKFLEDISIEPAVVEAVPASKPVPVPAVKKDLLDVAKNADGNVEAAESLQFKYSLLLDVEVELVKNINLLRFIDEWYGVKYLYGGSTKRGIDCSALMQALFTSLYGIGLPRTAKMQHDASRKISRTELKEGDLLFFNTRGGVSHVGMYLTNNKFVHASTRGVTISDMFDSYYASRLIATGRILETSQTFSASVSIKP